MFVKATGVSLIVEKGYARRKKEIMIPIETAWAIVDKTIQKVLPAEIVPVRDALNRVLAVGQRSKVDLPPFDKSGQALGPASETRVR